MSPLVPQLKPAACVMPHRRSFRGLTLAEIERRTVLGAVDAADGDKMQAAKILGIGKTRLYRS